MPTVGTFGRLQYSGFFIKPQGMCRQASQCGKFAYGDEFIGHVEMVELRVNSKSSVHEMLLESHVCVSLKIKRVATSCLQPEVLSMKYPVMIAANRDVQILRVQLIDRRGVGR